MSSLSNDTSTSIMLVKINTAWASLKWRGCFSKSACYSTVQYGVWIWEHDGFNAVAKGRPSCRELIDGLNGTWIDSWDGWAWVSYRLTVGATRHPKAQCQQSFTFSGLWGRVCSVLTPGVWWLAGVCGLQMNCSDLFLHPHTALSPCRCLVMLSLLRTSPLSPHLFLL